PGASPTTENLAGDWFLVLDLGDVGHTGVLQFEAADNGIAAFVDGGPVALTIEGDRLELDIDTRDGGGRLLSYLLSGSLDGGVLSGVLQPPLDAPAATWHAERIVPAQAEPPRPVDFSGIWSRTSSGIAKVHLDYTAAAQRAVDDYHYLDDPALRCVSPGVVRVSGWPYPLEILQNDTQLTILYESFHEVRRIHLDGRDFPAELPHRAMGYSIGHWEGSTLVVETRQLTQAFVDLNGQPLSEDARVIERMSLSDDGQRMRSEMTIFDPANYRRPIVRHRQWRKTPETVILEYDCDPYPFFRGLELEGALEEYWDRMRQRR
ncbi:MAG: hypothetical protein R3305_03430, partial [Gammaproteobacteria bacterium]|nr:hypothetical protein [Gammaproteobacteria bacterium]